MADKRDRGGLGRGLSSLLGEPTNEGGVAPTPDEPADGEITTVPIARISPNPNQPRTRFDDDAISTLADSIAASGLLQPLVVRPVGDGYELIAGERRWRAARAAGLERVPVVVRDADDAERLRLALMENVVREDLSAIEIAHGCAALVEDFGLSHSDVGRTLGRSRAAVSNLLRLLELPDDVQDLIVSGDLTEGHGRAILGADGAGARLRIARAVVSEGLSVRATEALVAAGEAGSSPRPAPPLRTELDDRTVEQFGRHFDVPVRVRHGASGRRVVELRFDDQRQLEATLARLSLREPEL